jgi:hypothetical protein
MIIGGFFLIPDFRNSRSSCLPVLASNFQNVNSAPLLVASDVIAHILDIRK